MHAHGVTRSIVFSNSLFGESTVCTVQSFSRHIITVIAVTFVHICENSLDRREVYSIGMVLGRPLWWCLLCNQWTRHFDPSLDHCLTFTRVRGMLISPEVRNAIHVGDRILEINGLPVATLLEKEVGPFSDERQIILWPLLMTPPTATMKGQKQPAITRCVRACSAAPCGFNFNVHFLVGTTAHCVKQHIPLLYRAFLHHLRILLMGEGSHLEWVRLCSLALLRH